MQQQITKSFSDQYHYAPTVVVRSPGRINLIGEHTDYNGGYVLPGAINLSIWCALGRRDDRTVRLYAHDLQAAHIVSLDAFEKSSTHTWANYVLGVVHELQQIDGVQLSGFDLCFGGNLPVGGGVSSSAALENGIGFGLNTLFSLGLERLDLVALSKRAENHYVGMPCGVMDMFASMMGRPDHLIKLNCRDLTYDFVPFPSELASVVLCNTMVKHALVDGAFAQRVAQCQEALAVIQAHAPTVRDLSDTTVQQLDTAAPHLSDTLRRRASHMYHENKRLQDACTALQLINEDNATKTLRNLRKLMLDSHRGLRDDYEVSCSELDFMVEEALSLSACIGARMSGGGFGGCTINLVHVGREEEFIAQMQKAYQAEFGILPECYHVRVGGGTELVFHKK